MTIITGLTQASLCDHLIVRLFCWGGGGGKVLGFVCFWVCFFWGVRDSDRSQIIYQIIYISHIQT